MYAGATTVLYAAHASPHHTRRTSRHSVESGNLCRLLGDDWGHGVARVPSSRGYYGISDRSVIMSLDITFSAKILRSHFDLQVIVHLHCIVKYPHILLS